MGKLLNNINIRVTKFNRDTPILVHSDCQITVLFLKSGSQQCILSSIKKYTTEIHRVLQ